VNVLVEKAREMLAALVKRAPDPPGEPQAKLGDALCLTPEQIKAAVEAERNDPKHRAELEYYREKCTEHLGGSR
jgi:hypothetical protein